ncbi:CHAT domain-containing protein [Gloeocapsopsis crepidinum LEGE 06123]|uniref:CHAT domain-containing protein n=1 Tax=Gloeocapsopsis crepidinum LEGE 06123 TaxID=588587 RepID=A0ABR9US32_9CHRO|nr:CHAT domain-containing protein [Gloeocapsopsis crepidinum]MBE9191076.1 CHAT domain-containing protein [Gloeocapsopsis crepidinum LEGE 06123]
MRQRRKARYYFILIMLLSSLTCLWWGNMPLLAQVPYAHQFVQQGIERYQAGDYNGAIAPWQRALILYQKAKNNQQEVAIVAENLARTYQQLGQSNQAIQYWEQAIAYYRPIDRQQTGRLLTEQAQSYSSMGQNRQAIALLCGAVQSNQECLPQTAVSIARSHKDLLGEAAAWGSLGEAYRIRGDYLQAIDYLQHSLKIATEIASFQLHISALNSLGNTYSNLAQVSDRASKSAERLGESEQANQLRQQVVSHTTKAVEFFQNSLKVAQQQNDRVNQTRAYINLIPLYYQQENFIAAAQANQQALVLWQQLPDNRNKIYTAIDLAKRQQSSTNSPLECLNVGVQPNAIALLKQATSIAQKTQDNRALSFVVGELGHIYECRKDYTQALKLTQQARWAAEQDKDSLYLWEWQTGRIYQAQNQKPAAISAYEKAITTIETIRDEILTANRDLQFDFRDTVEPIYRDLITLKLNDVPPSVLLSATDANTKNLTSVLTTADSLKLAELQNYFGDDCALTVVNPQGVDIGSIDRNTVIFSSLVLDERTAIIASFPNGDKKVTWLDKDSESLRKEINEFRLGLESFFDDYNPQPAQKVYDWLIRPFTAELEQAQIDTLVFIQDGILRSVPMAALHDGEKFLIQKYAVATTPGLSLTELKASNPQNLRALALGLTERVEIDGQEFAPLPYVQQEIGEVQEHLKGSTPLLNEEFNRTRLQQELSSNTYPIIHIATHGVFGTVPENTFLVTGNQEKLTITELDRLIRSTTKSTEPIELLTLTACQTAIGDDRAALGLAGVAVQAGAKSALASLWSIEDAATAQVAAQFYESLKESRMSKAQALQTAQLSLIEQGGIYTHPAYWAPFILIGNWL